MGGWSSVERVVQGFPQCIRSLVARQPPLFISYTQLVYTLAVFPLTI